MVKKHLVAYGNWTADHLAHIARFDMVDTGRETLALTDDLKALNPNIIIIAYHNIMAMHTNYEDWPEVNAHEDWFIHDVNGNRLQNSKYGWYCMDARNPEWRQHYANQIKSMLDTYSALDGIFADDVWDVWSKRGWTVPEVDVPDIPDWHDGVLALLTLAKNTIGAKLLIPNTPNYTDYVDVSDGKFDEIFIHVRWTPPDSWPDWWTIDDYLAHVDALASISSRGKHYCAHAGCTLPASPTPEDLEKAKATMLHCLCSYLLGVNGANATFGWNNIWAVDGSGYYPEMDIDIGNPKGSYYMVSGSLYGRNFDHAKVFANFSDTETYTVEVEETTYTLTPHTGVIAPWEATPTPLFPNIREKLYPYVPRVYDRVDEIRLKYGVRV